VTPPTAPSRKVGTAALDGALVFVGISIYERITGHTVDGAMSSALQTIAAFGIGYVVPEPAN
jgi:hypothetical protein